MGSWRVSVCDLVDVAQFGSYLVVTQEIDSHTQPTEQQQAPREPKVPGMMPTSWFDGVLPPHLIERKLALYGGFSQFFSCSIRLSLFGFLGSLVLG